MRVLLLAALCGYANAVTCADTDDGTGGAQEAVCVATGGVSSFFTVGATDDCVPGAGDVTDCTLAAGPCCTACATGYHTCTAIDAGVACSVGYGLAVLDTSGACTECAAETTWNNAADGTICAGVTAVPSGSRLVTAGTTIADNIVEACSDPGATLCPDAAATSTQCATGHGLTGTTCAACEAGTWNGATDAEICAADPGCVVATAGSATFISTPWTASSVAECTSCGDAQALTCSAASTATTCSIGWGVVSNVCTQCTGHAAGVTDCSAADVATKCASTYGLAAGACALCTVGTHWNAADDANICAENSCAIGTYQTAASTSGDANDTCGDCGANATTCTASAALTCDAGFLFADDACAAACGAGTFRADAGTDCAAWTAQCADGEVPKADGTTTTDRATTACAACTTAGAATCGADDVALTCADGTFPDLPACTTCTALTALPANASANTVTCTDATNSVAATVTCKATHADTDADATNGCEAAVAAADPASASDSVADSTADSGKSPAFIAGTAIAAIALLL